MNQTAENLEELNQKLMKIRYMLNSSPLLTKSEQELQKQIKALPAIVNSVKKFTETLISNTYSEEKLKDEKIHMYFFQILNMLIIRNDKCKFDDFGISIDELCDIVCLYFVVESNRYIKSTKCLLILVYNIFKNQQRLFVVEQGGAKSSLWSIVHEILTYHYEGLNQKVEDEQLQVKHRQQLEWVAYIVEELSKSKCHNEKAGFIEVYFGWVEEKFDQSKQMQAKSHFLHILGNFLSLVVENRTTTEIVEGFECQIKDIQQMYSKCDKNKVCNIKLSVPDFVFLCSAFKHHFAAHKADIKNILTNWESHLSQSKQFDEEWIIDAEQNKQQRSEISVNTESAFRQTDRVSHQEIMAEIINVLNNCLYLGGYNQKLQTFAYKLLSEENLIQDCLEISFILYNNKRFSNKKSTPKVQLAKTPQSNLFQILKATQPSEWKQHQKQKILKSVYSTVQVGQLSTLLRLWTNLLHINAKALQFIEENLKYLHMVMSLTHESEDQMTMKNWAVLFIKNCCDSAQLREEIGKLKIEMKVDTD